MTLNLTASPRTSAARVVGFVDQGNVHRADAESQVTPWGFTADFSQGGTNRTVVAYPSGTEITLIADELHFPGVALGSFDAGASTVPAQFVEWRGDFTSGDLGSDKGVLHFVLDDDRTIEAHFADMNPLTMHVVGGADGSGTSLDVDVITEPLTIPPVVPGNSRGLNVSGTILAGNSGAIGLWGYFNDGSRVTLTVPEGSPFTSWSGDGAISGRSVTITHGEGGEVTLTFP